MIQSSQSHLVGVGYLRTSLFGRNGRPFHLLSYQKSIINKKNVFRCPFLSHTTIYYVLPGDQNENTYQKEEEVRTGCR